MLVAVGGSGPKHHSAYYRLFAAARWSLDALGLALFHLIVPLLAPGPVPLTLDDTLARKRGLKVFGAGMHHDPLASSRHYAVTSWGHSWVVLAVRVRLPCVPGRFFSLPILFRLYLNQKAAAGWRVAYRTRPELAVELLERLCKSVPERRFHAYADSAYGGQSVLAHLPSNCDLTSRLPLDARLYAAPPEHRPGTRGRPRKRGERLPSPQQMLEQQQARRLTLELYGRQDKVRVVEAVAHWYAVPQRPLKIVVVEPLTGGRPVQAIYSTVTDEPANLVRARVDSESHQGNGFRRVSGKAKADDGGETLDLLGEPTGKRSTVSDCVANLQCIRVVAAEQLSCRRRFHWRRSSLRQA